MSEQIERRIPVIEERARVDKQMIDRDVVKVSTSIKHSEQVLTETLRREDVDIRRVPIGREVDTMPDVRQEGDVTVIPIVEERAVLVKRLVLVEELHVHRRTTAEVVRVPVDVRSTEISVERQGSPSGEPPEAICGERAMTTRTITAIYDSEAEARAARQQLVSNGLDDDDVRIVSQNLTSSTVSGERVGEDKGMWESIKDFFVGDDDRPVYSEGLRRGGYLLTARVEDEQGDRAIELLEQTNAVDLDERAEQWRAEGWSGEDTAYVGRDRTSYDETDVRNERSDFVRDDRGTRDEQAIPVVEERLRVGKREVDRGGVRVRSYVVEEPVHEEVSLRQERVEVERRPASGRATAQGEDLFREQTIEVDERSEEAVVAKDAVVTGEVVVRKSADERTESIDETVRRTEVDVDDTRGPDGKSGAAKGKSTRSNRQST